MTGLDDGAAGSPWFSPLNPLTHSIAVSDMVDSSSYLCDKHPGIMEEPPELELDFKLQNGNTFLIRSL